MAGEELVKYKVWYVSSLSNTRAGWCEAHQIQGLVGEELIKYNGWQVRNTSNTRLAGEEREKSTGMKVRYLSGARASR
jgi:hypothetical protein